MKPDPDTLLLLEQAEAKYHVKPIGQNKMGGTSAKIFEVQRHQTPFILKVYDYSAITHNHVEMELNWTQFLSSHMDGIVKPICSIDNQLYEIVSINDKKYILSLLEKAKGKIVDSQNPAEFNADLYFNLGALMGNMHRLTADYEGKHINSDFVWSNDAYSWRANVPILDEDVRLAEDKYKNEISTLPISKDSYGIIHYDIHSDNFFVHNGQITLFDFDACQLNWYAADIASALFFMVQKAAGPLKHMSEKQRTEFAEAYLIAYLRGYSQTNKICDYWIKTFDLFMKYQMVDEFRAAQTYMKEMLGPQHQYYLEWHKDRIIHNKPFVSIDYQKVMNTLSNNVRL